MVRIVRWLIGGAALLGCARLNYERLVGRRAVARVGLTCWGFTNFVHEYQSTTGAIVGAARLMDLSFLPGQRETWAEIGFAASAGTRSFRNERSRANGPWLAANGIVGFRFQGTGRGFSFRVVYSPIYVLHNVAYAPRKGFSHASAASIGWVY